MGEAEALGGGGDEAMGAVDSVAEGAGAADGHGHDTTGVATCFTPSLLDLGHG
uniref:Uncharacterized protein n=1 Tax=Arundo donax TaxID=35708 RepID=A0A0A9GRF0_ARUDO